MEADDNSSGRGTEAGGLDMSDPRDLALVGRAILKWPDRWRCLDNAKKDKIVAGMDAAMNLAGEFLGSESDERRLTGATLALDVANTAVKMVTHQQKDDHHAVDAARGAGEHNRTVNKIIVIPSPVVKDMAEMRKLAQPKGEE